MNNQRKWDDPSSKESHEGKTLSTHIEEIRKHFEKLASFYDIPDFAKKFIEPVISYHDHGKLSPLWNVRNEKNPPHSYYSICYLKDRNIVPTLKESFPNSYDLILYLILKHHSSLYKITRFQDNTLQWLCRESVKDTVNKMSFEERVAIIDSFGLFKLADVLSASNKDIELERPRTTEDIVKRIILTDKGGVDEERWREQVQLERLGQKAILTAYTGWGKTDSAMLFFANKGLNKVFYLFPMITAINKFHNKLSRHIHNVEKYFYLYEYEISQEYGESRDEAREFVFSLFSNSHFLSPIVITTVDQLLLTFLQLGKYYTKRVMFRKAGIVVDEVHLLNPKMLFLLLHFLNRFMPIYKLSVLFMSATLPDSLKEVIREKMGETSTLDLREGYRKLLRINYSLDKMTCTLIDDVSWIVKQMKEGKSVLVVVNTVASAVKLKKKIEDEFERYDSKLKDKLLLLHARFMYKDRQSKEDAIDFLKGKPHILVCTQVCEVSLDVSYDVLLTEIAPLPSLIQRFGRVNRYGRDKVKDTNVYIYKQGEPDYDGYPYDKDEIEMAKGILQELYPLRNEYELIERYNQVESLEKLQRTIREVEKEMDFSSFWEGENRTAYFFSFKLDEEELKQRILQLRDELTMSIIPDTSIITDEDTLTRLNEIYSMIESRRLSGEQLFKKITELRGYIVPVQLSIAKKYATQRKAGFPVLCNDELIYTRKYGLVKRSMIN